MDDNQHRFSLGIITAVDNYFENKTAYINSVFKTLRKQLYIANERITHLEAEISRINKNHNIESNLL